MILLVHNNSVSRPLDYFFKTILIYAIVFISTAYAGPKEDTDRLESLGHEFVRIAKRVQHDEIDRHGDVDRNDIDRLKAILREVKEIARNSEIDNDAKQKAALLKKVIIRSDSIPYKDTFIFDAGFISKAWVASLLLFETHTVVNFLHSSDASLGISILIAAFLANAARLPFRATKALKAVVWDANHAPLLSAAQLIRTLEFIYQNNKALDVTIANARPFFKVLEKNHIGPKNIDECEALLTLPVNAKIHFLANKT